MSDDLIPLEEAISPPKLPGKVVLRPTEDEIIDALAAEILLLAIQCVRQIGDFHIALSGGSTPMPLYRRLMYDPAYRQLPWARTHLWIVDERRVPFEDDRSNYGHLHDVIVSHSGIPPQNVHPIQATAEDADTRYEQELRTSLARREPGFQRLDFILLGMGNDAHTASLFPHSPALFDTPGAEPRLAKINAGPRVTPPDRVTMTYETINSARQIAVMVVGEGKRATIERVSRAYTENQASGTLPYEELPILGVRPRSGELRWFMDAAACPR